MDPEKNKDLQDGMIRRIGGWILGLTIAGAAAAWAWRGGMSALSVALGGGLAFFGYRTHIRVVDRALQRQTRARRPVAHASPLWIDPHFPVWYDSPVIF